MPSALAAMEQRYGLGQPIYVQYWKWISGILLRGDFGQSFEWNQPVSDLIWGRLALTFIISLVTLLFTWAVAFPIGIYSAVRQYSIGDYIATIIGYIGLAIPNFLLALILMYVAFKYLQPERGRALFARNMRMRPGAGPRSGISSSISGFRSSSSARPARPV